MLNLLKVSDDRFEIVFNKMTDAFPYEERRSPLAQKKCMGDERFHFLEILDDTVPVGFIALWDFSDYIYIEHLAIDSDKRSGGYGSKTLNEIKNMYDKKIILEAEAPETEQQKKRINFYNKAGFKVNNYDYEQPSYHGGDGVPLMILSYPDFITEEEFEKFVSETKNSVYTYCD